MDGASGGMGSGRNGCGRDIGVGSGRGATADINEPAPPTAIGKDLGTSEILTMCGIMASKLVPKTSRAGLTAAEKTSEPEKSRQLQVVKKGDTLFISQYLFTGSKTMSVWFEVLEISGENVNCLVKNTATLAGPICSLHVSQVHISLPTLSEYDKQAD